MRISSHRLDRSRSPGVRHSDVPPLPPPLHPDHDRIWGVTDEGPLAQVNMPAWRFTFVRCCGSLQASISHDLTAKPTSATSVARIDSCNCLSLMVTSDRSHKGLSPSITAPCPAQLPASATPSPAEYSRLLDPDSLTQPGTKIGGWSTDEDFARACVRSPSTDAAKSAAKSGASGARTQSHRQTRNDKSP